MQTNWKEWLAAERAAGRGGAVLWQPSIVRGQPYTLILPIPGDHTDATFAAAVFVGVAEDLAPLAEFETDIGAFDEEAGVTPVTLTLAGEDTGDDLPPDDDFNGLAEVVFKLDYTPAGGTASRALGLVIPVVE